MPPGKAENTSSKARRWLLRLLTGSARRVWLVLCFWLALLGCSPVVAQSSIAARYGDPTTRYGHGVLGDNVEYGTLTVTVERVPESGAQKNAIPRRRDVRFRLPRDHVFEDVAPRLIDLDNDGMQEVIVIETSRNKGARLAIYDHEGRITATPYIGRSHRWLAPIGAADLDGDGRIEIAYIDRPHLAKTLRIWRYERRKLSHVADQPGLTNHRIGWDHIPGGIRSCGTPPEIITANADWTRIIVSTLQNGVVQTKDIGTYTDPDSLNAALTCP